MLKTIPLKNRELEINSLITLLYKEFRQFNSDDRYDTILYIETIQI